MLGPTGEPREGVENMLLLGLDPSFPDRWGRMLHEYITLTPVQWRTIVIDFGYPICGTKYVVNPYNNDEESPIITMAETIIEDDLDYERPLQGVILTREEYYLALQRDASCMDERFLTFTREILRQEIERFHGRVSDGTSQQLQIFADGLARFRNRRLSNDLARGVHGFRRRQVARELEDLPEMGNFMGGLQYQQ